MSELSGRSRWEGVPACRQPFVDAGFESASCAVVGNWVAARELNSAVVDSCTATADVLFGGVALPDAMVVLAAERAPIRA